MNTQDFTPQELKLLRKAICRLETYADDNHINTLASQCSKLYDKVNGAMYLPQEQFNNIKKGYAWCTIQYLINTTKPLMTEDDFDTLVEMLADDRRLFDENLIAPKDPDGLSSMRESVSIITYKTYLANFKK